MKIIRKMSKKWKFSQWENNLQFTKLSLVVFIWILFIYTLLNDFTSRLCLFSVFIEFFIRHFVFALKSKTKEKSTYTTTKWPLAPLGSGFFRFLFFRSSSQWFMAIDANWVCFFYHFLCYLTFLKFQTSFWFVSSY